MEPSLKDLAIKHGADKYGTTLAMAGAPKDMQDGLTHGHTYAVHYDTHFSPFRHRENLNILEIGVGGYQDPSAGGQSLRMWKEYFPHGQVVSLDYYDKAPLQEERIRIYRGSQDDAALLRRMSDECGGFDIIVDDGSHCCAHVIASLQVLFPLLRDGGIYAVEDLQTSYWNAFGGSSTDLSSPKTSMGFIKRLVDGLNHVEFELPGYEPTYFDKHVVSMHFYHNLAFIYKGNNDEKSNIVVDNELPDSLKRMKRPEWMADK